MPDSYCMILCAVGNQDEAARLAELLVTRRLAACVQILGIASCYMWEGQLNKDSEYLLLIKTASHLYAQVETAILENHSYQVPEIVQIPITQGLDRYLGWISENTGPTE